MFFSDSSHIKILSVLELEWSENNTNVISRPYHALSYRFTGNAVISDSNHKAEPKDGDLLYMPAGADYHIKSGAEHIIAIHFDLISANTSVFHTYSPTNPAVFEKDFTDLLNVWNKKNPGYYFRAISLLYKIFEHMTRQFSSHYNEYSYQRIKDAVEYLHLNFKDAKLSVEQLCRISGLSDTQFRKLFFDIYETSPIKYINQLRIDYASDLLNGSFYTVEEISSKSGFTDTKYFSTVFKKYMNCPPSIYRKR